ncbi:MAG: hypothetical protein HY263_07670 [Chloroflexi bacterium]|nr:hypothetical protein [Chloroflexota bacterium]
MARPLGCLTGSALIAAGLASAAILAIAVATGNGVFSPGELSAARGTTRGGVASHAELGTRCDACHAPIWSGDRMADRCRACHTEVATEIATRSGLHGTIAGADDCRDCHTDHRGPNASLTVVDLARFPHDQMGFSLQAHSVSIASGATTCEACHPGSLSTFAVASCAACHQRLDATYLAAHEADFGTSCLACHDGLETYGKGFAHATFPLTGGHGGRACAACHHGATTLVALKDAPTACVTCHLSDDIHAGRLGTACADCHTPASWSGASLDHAATGFALTGGHASPTCDACHPAGRFAGTPTTCIGCHKADDAHNGSFGTDCGACHKATTWSDVTFDHAKSGFALTGAHATASCQQCHIGGVFTAIPTACVACHPRPASHTTGFSNTCQSCHTTRAWTPATFNGPHSFPMSHGGAGGVCSTCHPSTFAAWTCTACHSTASMAAQHSGVSGYSATGCIRCHPTGSGGD